MYKLKLLTLETQLNIDDEGDAFLKTIRIQSSLGGDADPDEDIGEDEDRGVGAAGDLAGGEGVGDEEDPAWTILGGFSSSSPTVSASSSGSSFFTTASASCCCCGGDGEGRGLVWSSLTLEGGEGDFPKSCCCCCCNGGGGDRFDMT